jgi:hypothetical protein
MSKPWSKNSRSLIRKLAVGLLLGAFCCTLAPAALAKPKKKEEAAEVETKSYVLPYFIVIMMVAGGLMVVGRPSRRLDSVDDKKGSKGKDEE